MAPQRNLSSSAQPASGARRKLRIIVADDNKDEAMTLATVLGDEGHEVREVYRGDAVLHMIGEFKPDAIFLDVGMPGMSGYAVARELRQRFGEGAPLLVAVTGWSKTSERLLGQIVGFDHYLTKPYEIGELLGLLSPLVTGIAPAAGRAELTDEQRLLVQAAKLMGQEELARGLRVSESVLESWMEGRSSIPHQHLLNLADVPVTLASRLAEK